MEVALNTPWLKAFHINGCLLIWQRTDDSLHVLSGLSCWIFLGVDQGMDSTELLQEYHAVNPDRALDEQYWASIFSALQPFFLAGELSGNQYRQEFGEVFQQPASRKWLDKGFCFRLNHLGYQIVSECDRLLEELAGYCSPRHGADLNVDCQLLVMPDGGAWSIDCNGISLAKSVKGNSLLPLLMDFIQVLNYQSADYLLAVHAAVVVKDGHALILPGQSGSGKSTLCAGLLQRGFSCYSDELAVLDHKGFAQPLPLPIGIKSGSWSYLEPEWPELADASVWQRPDGRQLKYLRLPDGSLPGSNSISRQTLLFPTHDADCQQPVWCRLPPEQSLLQLTRAGYQLKTGLTEEKIMNLLEFAQRTPAYTLSYAKLSQIEPFINDLLSKDLYT